MTDIKEHDHNEVDTLRTALVGRSVVSVRLFALGETGERIGSWGPTVEGEVTLDNGTVLKLAGNDGGCACSAGDYELTKLNDMPVNGIMDVEIVDDDVTCPEDCPQKDASYDCWEHSGSVYRLFVLAQDNRIELATFEGDDGNGYYGTGFWFAVTDAQG